MKFEGLISLHNLDKTLALAGIIFSVILIVLGAGIGRYMFLLMGILILASCLISLKIQKTPPIEFQISESRSLSTFWAICLFVLYILSILSVYFRSNLYERPLLYFILTALMAGVIACEVLISSKKRVGFILIQILMLGMSIAWSQLLIFPGLIGIDPWYHSAFTNQIIHSGYIPEGYSYSKIPLFHLMIAITSLISNLPYKFATMASVSLGQIICNSVFVCLIANLLFKNHRIGILAALMVIIANFHIQMSYESIPNAFAVVFIPIIFYIMLSMGKNNNRKNHTYIKNVFLAILLMIGIILSHSITAMCMAILLFAAWGSLTFYRTFISRIGLRITLLIPVGFTLTMFAWWDYISGHIQALGQLIKYGFSVDIFYKVPVNYSYYASLVPLGEQVFNTLPLYAYFTISFIGIFYMISKRGNVLMFIMALVGITPLAIVFVSLISGSTIIISRWWYFAQILLSIPLAASIYIVGRWKSKNTISICALVFGFVVVLGFLMIMSTAANVDNHTFSKVTGHTYAYTQSEMIASDFFATNSAGTLSSDRNYCTNPSGSIFRSVYGINPDRLISLDNSLIYGKFEHDGSIKILRSKVLQEPLIRGGYFIYLRPDMNHYISSLGFNKIYENSAVTGYIG